MFYRLLKIALLGPLLRLLFRPKVEGLRNIPGDGPVIIAGNHLAFLDSVFIPLVVPRDVVFLGKAEYFTGRGVKGRLIAAFFRGAGMIPVDRGNGRGALAAIQAGQSVLRDGGVFGIHPEGTRSPDGRLYRGKPGVARLALDSGAPVVPAALINTDKIQPLGKRLPRIGKVHLRFGAPLDFTRYGGPTNDRAVLRAITDEIMYSIMELSGREYVDIYATTAKQAAAHALELERAA